MKRQHATQLKQIVHAYCVPEQMNDWSDDWGGAVEYQVSDKPEDIAFCAQEMRKHGLIAIVDWVH